MLLTYKKDDILQQFANALLTTKNGHSKKAYNFALDVVNTLPDNTTLKVRQSLNALNIGDIVECAINYHLRKNNALSYALQGENDIDRNTKNEVKTFSCSNRYPNALKTITGFIAVSQYGVHYITKKMVEKNLDTMRIHKGLPQPTLKWLQDIIQNEQPKKLMGLTKKMGF